MNSVGLLLFAIGLVLEAQDGSASHSTPLPQGSTDDRVRAAERKLDASPNDIGLQGTLASAYLQKLRETGDGSYLQRVSRLVDRMELEDGGSSVALRLQNEIDLQRHEFRAVAERARSMTKYAPSDPGNWGNLGDALMEMGEYTAAGEAYTKMFTLRPNLASYNRLGFYRFVSGDAAGAIASMRQAVDAGGAVPENTAWCWAELGDMYFKTAEMDEAEGAYRSALDLFPTLHRAYAGLGKVEAERGHAELAIRDYERAQRIVPLVEYAGALEKLYRGLGSARKADGQLELIDAIDALGRASREQTNRTLALILADRGRRLDRALELMEAEIPVRGDVYTWDAMSWVLFKVGRAQEARVASLKAVRMSTPEPDFYRHAAAIAEAVGETEAAEAYRRRLR
jgi:tetratricopeptide (TPR) repeat protein